MTRDESLATLGRLAHDAVWRTPIYSTHGLDDERAREYKRLNDILIGQALTKALADSGRGIVRYADETEDDAWDTTPA
ncbi:hypothetical protein [Mycobacterium phage WXIN]|nr:hypothetical protein [Mycobacterium phage WXIN]